MLWHARQIKEAIIREKAAIKRGDKVGEKAAIESTGHYRYLYTQELKRRIKDNV